MENQYDKFQIQPAIARLVKGKLEAWCSCGKSLKQPFCDGTHRSTTFKPIKFIPEEDREFLLCMCKNTKNPPFCDGSHEILPPENQDKQ